MDKSFCILVNSCDEYEEAWTPFFSLLLKYWKGGLPNIYLNTETKIFNHPNVVTLNSPVKDWTGRLIDSLLKIQSQFVLLMLDDFFVMKSIDTHEIYRCISIMENNSEIGCFVYKKTTGQESKCYFEKYYLMNPHKKYFITFQAALWRTDALLKMVPRGFSPWDIEEKMIFNKSDYLLFCSSDGSYTNCDNDVVPYLWALSSGYGICKSKWLWNNKKIFKKNGIVFKRKHLGYMSKIGFILLKIKRRFIRN